MADPQDFTDDELLRIFKNPKSDLSQLSRGEQERLDRLTDPAHSADAIAAAEQQKLEKGSGPFSQLTMKNVGQDLSSAVGGAWNVAKAIGRAAIKDPLGLGGDMISQEEMAKMREDAANRPSLSQRFDQAKGFLKTLPSIKSVGDAAWAPIDVAQSLGLTPELAAQGAGAVTGAALAPVVTHKVSQISPAGVKAFTGKIVSDIPVIRKWGPAVQAYQKAAAGEAPAVAGVIKTARTAKPAKVPLTPAEQMGMGGPPTGSGAMMDTFPTTPPPERARAPMETVPATLQAGRADAAAAGQAAREAQSADLGVSPASTGATLEGLPETPVPDRGMRGAADPTALELEQQATAAERHQALMKELGLETPPTDVEAPNPATVSGEGRERIPVPVKSEPPPPPPAPTPPPSNTLMKAKTLQEILDEARQQQDVPTRTTAPADVRPAGEGRAEFGYSSGRPAQTGEQYGQTVGNVPEGAPRTGELDAAKIEAAAADKSAAAADQARRQQAAAALPYDANVPLGPAVHSGENLSPEVLAEIRQMAAEMSNLPYVQSKGEFGGVGQGKYGPETIVKGTGGAPVYNDITGAGGYGSRGDVSREIDRVLDGTGGPNANTRAIIETARERVRSGYRPVVSDQSYKTLNEMRQHEYDLLQKSIQNLENPAAAGAGASAGEAAPDFREGLKRQLMQLGEERGTPIDEAAIDEALKDPGAMLGSVAEKFAIGNDDTSFEFGSSAETPAAGEASPVGVGKSGQIPTTQADELERLRLKHGARDASRKHWSGVSEDTTRATTPAPDTGQLSKRSNLLSTEAHDRIENKVNDMVAAGATDTELAAYADNANTQKATDYIHILIRSALKKAGRPMFALGAAAAGGASLRKALVDQLGGSGKQDQ